MTDEEILIKIMEEYVPKTSRYVSCIRIDGKPILPPLISDEYRKELLHYRKLALSVEKKLKDKKLICDNRQSIDSGIITNAASEPSWLNNCVLPMDNVTTSFSGDSEFAVNCKSNVSQSDISENASSKTLICDDDMWRYLSKCSSENYTTCHIDISEYDISSDISQKFEKNYDDLNNPLSKSMSKLASDCALEQAHESIQHSIVQEVKGANVSHKCNTVDVFDNNSHKDNQCQADHLIELRKDNILNLQSENNKKETSAFHSENNSCRKYTNNKVICMNLQNTINITNEESVPSLCNGSLAREPEQCKNVDIDYERDLNQEECVMTDKAVSELITSRIEECQLLRNSGRNLQETVELNNSCELLNLASVSSTTNCLQDSFNNTVCLSDYDKKIEKYDPLKYSSDGKDADVSYSCISSVYNTTLHSGNDNRSSGEIDGLESDCTFTDSYGNHMPEQFMNLDYSSASQKINKEIPLSESISISDIDFQACSVATMSQDTPEEASELCNESSVNKNSDSDGPRLVRQNSYTLIAPSPVLLAHAKASEKLENGGMSEDDNSLSQKCKVGRKSWDTGKGKMDCDLGKTGKCIYAVPLKQTSDFNRTVISSPNEVRSPKCKVFSLPGSSVASPVKINPYFSSVDNLPMVNVRKFHEFISSKANFHQLPSESHEMSELEVTDQILSSFIDVPCDKIVNPGKVDLVNCNLNGSDMLGNERKSPSKLIKGPGTGDQVNNYGFINVEETYKCTSFSESATSHFLGNSETYVNTNCENENKNYQQSSHDSYRIKPNDHNSPSKPENDHLLVQNTCTSPFDNTVQSVFLQLQRQHSLLMAQLLDRQKKEQETLANTFLNQQRQILREMKLIPADSSQHASNLDDESLSVNSNKNSPPNLPEIPSAECVSKHSQSYKWDPQNEGGISLSGNEVKDQSPDRIEDSKYSTCYYEKKDLIDSLNLPQKKILSYSEEHKKAVTVINAYTRGYLVRRLLKTEHVQEIIKTISESVMCALQLQRECPVDITPSDIELHRRLIQQLTAACHSLHETFFSLTLQEKLNIIATDREKKSLQLPRPVSAKSAITSATQKYLQRKQQLTSSRQLDRPVSSTRRSWWRSKGRVSSAGNYDQPSSCLSKQPNGISSKQQQGNNRSTRRPWR